MLRALIAGAVLMLATSPAAAAQSPRITSSGDPSIRNDTIYRLVVDPAAYPEDDFVYLLDDGVLRVEADGRATRTYRQVVQLLTEEAVEQFNERTYGWSPETERFRLNWIRVLRPDGSVISDGPAQSQEADVPVAMGDPVYSSRKRLRVSLAGLTAGAILDYSFTTEETKAWLPGDLSTSWSIHTGVPVRRSRYIVDAPASMVLNITERNLTFRPHREVRRGRQVITWAANDLPVIKEQSFAADTLPRYMSLWITGTTSWDDIGGWYGGLARDRYTLDARAMRVVDSVVQGAATRADSVRALHKYVAQDVRYVSISLGLGGYRPRPPADVVQTGFGDCKDKATLFVAALRRWGIPASSILLSSVGGVDSTKPTLTAFDHVIAQVEIGGQVVYTDLTASNIPFGEIPIAIEGSFALVVPVTGPVRQIRFPDLPPTAHAYSTELIGTIDTLGRVSGRLTVSAQGARAVALRNNYQNRLDPVAHTNLARRIAQSIYEGARADSLQVFDGRDLQAPPRVSIWFSNGKALQPSGRSWILSNPMGTLADLENTAVEVEKEVERDGSRWAPISIAQAAGTVSTEYRVELRLPAGWKIEVPQSIQRRDEFGEFDAVYSFEGDRFRARRRFVGATGTLPPERVDDLIGYFRALAADNTPFLTVTPAP